MSLFNKKLKKIQMEIRNQKEQEIYLNHLKIEELEKKLGKDKEKQENVEYEIIQKERLKKELESNIINIIKNNEKKKPLSREIIELNDKYKYIEAKNNINELINKYKGDVA